MNDAIILSPDPLFEVKFKDEGFEINNEAVKNDNSLYLFKKVASIQLEKKRANWFVSILSLAIDFFSGSSTGGVFKEWNQLKFECGTFEKRIMMDNGDMDAAERVVQKIKLNINR